jgi:hypothetical protein
MTEEDLPREFQNLGEYSNKELPTEGVIKPMGYNRVNVDL